MVPSSQHSNPSSDGPKQRPKRRARYQGTHPRHFHEKYKELNPEKYSGTVQRVIASGKTPAGMHRPVMVEEILKRLDPQPGEIGVDCTLGYGGHALALWQSLQPGGRLIGLDTDPIELPKTTARLHSQITSNDHLTVIASNFAGLGKVLKAHEIEGADVVLADLGVSSMQLDDPTRGFSFKHSGPLDLRMNPLKGQPASFWLGKWSEAEISEVLFENADEPRAAILARAVVTRRRSKPIQTTHELVELIRHALLALPLKRSDEEIRGTCQRVFQAIRIAVNDEFSALETFLRQLPDCLRPNGRVGILTFHSGEDRRVKHAFLNGWKSGLYSQIAREVERPSREEVHANPRASCAKLRWAIRSGRVHATSMESASSHETSHPLLKFIPSSIHGTGAFATMEISANTALIEYLGERITKRESRSRSRQNNCYLFALDDESDLDGDFSWNPARLINHSCDPNCEVINRHGHLWIVSKRPIPTGEEVTFNYGFDLANYREHPCRCGSLKCIGFMVAEEFHRQVSKQEGKSDNS